MLKTLEKVLGLGVIPPGYKSGIYGFLVAGIALLSEFDVPGLEWATESLLMKVAAVLAIAAALVLKQMRA